MNHISTGKRRISEPSHRSKHGMVFPSKQNALKSPQSLVGWIDSWICVGWFLDANFTHESEFRCLAWVQPRDRVRQQLGTLPRAVDALASCVSRNI